jgi:hypothetical protein
MSLDHPTFGLLEPHPLCAASRQHHSKKTAPIPHVLLHISGAGMLVVPKHQKRLRYNHQHSTCHRGSSSSRWRRSRAQTCGRCTSQGGRRRGVARGCGAGLWPPPWRLLPSRARGPPPGSIKSGESAPGCWGRGSARQALTASRASRPSARRVVAVGALGDMLMMLVRRVLGTAR